MLTTDPKQRFSNRVEDYVRYRPGYPREIVDVLRDGCGLTPESVVVDVGSGTGMLTQLFSKTAMWCMESSQMRPCARRATSWRNIDTSLAWRQSPATTLPDASADFVVAGQAFHWFDAS